MAGARRFRAAQLAELFSLPARIVEITDAQALEWQLVENAQRVDVQPCEEAQGFQLLLDMPRECPRIRVSFSRSQPLQTSSLHSRNHGESSSLVDGLKRRGTSMPLIRGAGKTAFVALPPSSRFGRSAARSECRGRSLPDKIN